MTAKKKTPVTDQRQANVDFPVVGIGASAGGLEAMEGFLSHVPSDCGIAFVIVQHRSPDHKSILSSLLHRYTKMKIIEVEERTTLEANCVYLNPPTSDVSIMDRQLFLVEPEQKHGARLPIDYFFRSLAQDCGDKAIGIVLSGTGTDGTYGLKEIKAAGGMAMVQKESQSRYSGMPKSAIDTGLIDFVLPVEKMPAELMKYIKHPSVAKEQLPPKKDMESYLQSVFLIVRNQTGHDFSGYKRTTIWRRVQRRMAVHQIDKVEDYVDILKKDSEEVKSLLQDFLITVTNFFRDPQAFDSLYEKVILPLVQAKSNDDSVRVWIPGCATGEEAYSIAMLFSHAMKACDKMINVQIFATDIDYQAIQLARGGVYPDSIEKDVSREQL